MVAKKNFLPVLQWIILSCQIKPKQIGSTLFLWQFYMWMVRAVATMSALIHFVAIVSKTSCEDYAAEWLLCLLTKLGTSDGSSS
jgi:hypothetical protein